jgi:hypothetical protein
MGYTPRRHVYLLQFEGEEFEGLEVRMRAAKLGMMFDARTLAAIDMTNPSVADVDATLEQMEILADHIVSWNIEDEDGNPVPANLDGLKQQEVPLVGQIFAAWQQAMGDVTGPLPNSLSSSRPPDSLSLPMEPLAANLAS